MRQPSRARCFLSGLMAGMVIDSIQYLLDSFVFSDNWDALAKIVTPDPSRVAFALTAAKIVGLMQLVGLAAGMLALRWNTAHAGHGRAPVARNGAVAWLLTYGLICIAIVLISRDVADPAHRPVKLVQGIGFALSGLLGCWAGSWFGNWVYRESQQAAEEMIEA
jgi:hypothetical protein